VTPRKFGGDVEADLDPPPWVGSRNTENKRQRKVTAVRTQHHHHDRRTWNPLQKTHHPRRTNNTLINILLQQEEWRWLSDSGEKHPKKGKRQRGGGTSSHRPIVILHRSKKDWIRGGNGTIGYGFLERWQRLSLYSFIACHPYFTMFHFSNYSYCIHCFLYKSSKNKSLKSEDEIFHRYVIIMKKLFLWFLFASGSYSTLLFIKSLTTFLRAEQS